MAGVALHAVGGLKAGVFNGYVEVHGTLDVFEGDLSTTETLHAKNIRATESIAAPSKRFVIDHPLDPAHKSLVHASVESCEMMNLYSGIAILDAAGEAAVTLPDWFQGLNDSLRYQLTCIGAFAPVYIAQKVDGAQFRIAGGTPGMEVSWQIIGARADRWARENPLSVVVDKAKALAGGRV